MVTVRDIREELEQEAAFWLTLLKECHDAGASKTQRMRDALNLVEYKLAQITDSFH